LRSGRIWGKLSARFWKLSTTTIYSQSAVSTERVRNTLQNILEYLYTPINRIAIMAAPPTLIKDAPDMASYTPLSEHQSRTPSTFFSSKPVLYFKNAPAVALFSSSHLAALPLFEAPTNGTTGTANGDSSEVKQLCFPVDIYVASDYLTLWSSETKKGLQIPYPSITLHAIQRISPPTTETGIASSADSGTVQGLYMQLDLSPPSAEDADDDIEMSDPVELTLLPTPPTLPEPASPTPESSSTESPATARLSATPPQSLIDALFTSISSCQNLHPDPSASDSEGQDDGTDSRIQFEGNVGYEGITGLPGAFVSPTSGQDGLPPPFPGSGGWITAENVGEFFDEDGNFKGTVVGGEEEEGKEEKEESEAKRTRRE
jgi:nucleotide-sensitive chloride channel 1A